MVLLLRVEEAVLGALARSISGCVLGNSGPPVTPLPDTIKRNSNRCHLAQRFVVISDSNPCTLWLRGTRKISHAALHVGKKPDFRVSREVHGIDLPLQLAAALHQVRFRQNPRIKVSNTIHFAVKGLYIGRLQHSVPPSSKCYAYSSLQGG